MSAQQFATQIFTTPSGARVRIDSSPCNVSLTGTTVCGTRKKIYISFTNLDGDEQRSVVIVCAHKIQDFAQKGKKFTFDSAQSIVDLADAIHAASSLGIPKMQKWERVHSLLMPKYSFIDWYPKIETREDKGKGGIREARGTAKKFYESFFCGSTCGDVWDKNILRKDADATITFTPSSNVSQAPPKIQPQYSEKLCVCGHESFAHDARNYCCACKKFCDD